MIFKQSSTYLFVFILFLINSSSLYSQIIKPDLRNIYEKEEFSRDSSEISLDAYNKIMDDSNMDRISIGNPLVRPNNTVMMYYEVAAPEESEDAFEVGLPNKAPSIFNAGYHQQEEYSAMVGLGISGLSFDVEASLSGVYHIPPDPSGAVGTSHVCHVVNTAIHCHNKTTGVAATGFPKSMSSFFTSLSPANAGFDPKILWDQYEGRFVVVHLVKTQTSNGDPSNSSRTLLAVSDGADPTGTWNFQAIDNEKSIGGNDCWFDYPGLGIDDEAIYITGNYFRLSNNASCSNSEVIIIDKGVTGGIYNGTVSADEDPATNSDFAIYHPKTEAGAGFNATLQPAHIYGTPPTGTGNWLIGYSGLSNGTNEFAQIFRITDPLLPGISFVSSTLSMGNIDDTATGILDAPQSGGAMAIETNDRRSLGAVWQNDKLWMVTQVMPNSGTNSGQTTALWSKFNVTSSAFTFNQAGEIGGEDISTGAYTFMPSVAINTSGDIGVVFSGSNASIFPGSYAVGINGTTGGVTATETMQAGVDDYVRTFGGSQNRYGDYSGAAIDPSTDIFWGINQASIAGGTVLSGSSEDGRWQIFIKELDISPALPIELISFDVKAEDNTAMLYWKTATEINNEGFIIEQFIDNEFDRVGFKAGEGNTFEEQIYDFQVPDLSAGSHLFRLRQIDFDGEYSLSDVKSIEIAGADKNIISLPAPNPFSSETEFTIQVFQDQRVNIQVYDINGRLVESLNENILEKDQTYPFVIDGTSLPNGMYMIRVSGMYFNYAERIILER